MTKKVHYTDKQIDGFVMELIRQMLASAWKPDYIVGLTRGGLVPALKISQYLGIRMETLKVSLRDGGECESNCWMAEDAFGYINATALPRPEGEPNNDPALRKKILIVDDINDTGATLQWIKDDWSSGCLPNEIEVWNSVWNNNVRFATIVDNESSPVEVNYSAVSINKAEEDVWIVFPWEEWWKG